MQIGRYEVRGTLGRGGWSIVYLGWDPRLGREVALKCLAPDTAGDEMARRRLINESRILAQLSHPSIVALYDLDEEADPPYFVMELLRGTSAAQLVAMSGPLSFEKTSAIVEAVADALDYLHAEGFVHRDVKPGNVLVHDSRRVVLIDFGLAGRAGREDRDAPIAGTPTYMAPEVLRGDPSTAAADIYALGVVAFELLTGRPPFEGDSSAIMHAHLNAAVPSIRIRRPDLPEAVDRVIGSALAKDPWQRPARAGLFAAELAGWHGRSWPSPPSAPGPPPTLGFGPPPVAPPLPSNAYPPAPPPPSDSYPSVLPLPSSSQWSAGPPTLEPAPPPPAPGMAAGGGGYGGGGVYPGSAAPTEYAESPAPAARSQSPPFFKTVREALRGLRRRRGGPVDVPPDPTVEQPAEAPDEGIRLASTVFAPPAVEPGDNFFVQVFAHLPDEETAVQALAREFDDAAQRRGFTALDSRIVEGERLMFDLAMPGLVIDNPVRYLVWMSRPQSVQFGVTVPAEAPPRTVIGTVTISRDHTPIGMIKFKLAVLQPGDTRPNVTSEPVGGAIHRFRKAFISYASHDRREVLKRTQMLDRVGIEFFQDVLTLEPGQRWERELYRHIDDCDLFLLFWSSAAKQSTWVLKEVEYAIRRKQGDDMAPPEILPVIIEGPPLVPPPAELQHLHFDDRVLYFMR